MLDGSTGGAELVSLPALEPLAGGVLEPPAPASLLCPPPPPSLEGGEDGGGLSGLLGELGLEGPDVGTDGGPEVGGDVGGGEVGGDVGGGEVGGGEVGGVSVVGVPGSLESEGDAGSAAQKQVSGQLDVEIRRNER